MDFKFCSWSPKYFYIKKQWNEIDTRKKNLKVCAYAFMLIFVLYTIFHYERLFSFFSKDKLEYQMTAWHIQLSLLQKKDWNWLSQILNLLFGKKRSLIIEFGKMNSEALGLSSWKVLLGKGKMKNEYIRFVTLGIVTNLVKISIVYIYYKIVILFNPY